MRRKLNNRGFSLVELLVGVTILAVVVVPLIHAFVTSASTSTKARNLRSETVAVQNIIESYRTTSIAELLELLSAGGDRLGSLITITGLGYLNEATGSYDMVDLTDAGKIPAGGPGYKLELDDIRVDNKQYDAVLYLDATSEAIRAHNDAEIVSYKEMDAVYIEPNPVVGENPTQEELARQANSPDYIAAQSFASMATIESGLVVEPEHFFGKMTREITITIHKVGEDSDVVSCTAQFDYRTRFRWLIDQGADEEGTPLPPIVMTEDFTTSVTNDFFSGGYTMDSVYGLYFFFYPNTCQAEKPAGAVEEDTIKVVNRDDVAISVVLIRQGEPIIDYFPVIRLYESSGSYDKPPLTRLHYNNQSTLPYYYYYDDSQMFYKRIYFDGILVDTEAKNRLYQVRVELYRDGADLDADEPLSVFDASSLG